MSLHPVFESALAPFIKKSKRVKSWQEQQGDMLCKVELWQDGPQCFRVECYRLGQTIPVIYEFLTFEGASAHYSAFISFHQESPGIESKLAAELEMLHSLCASAQCWLDAAGHVVTNHETKCALQRNADAFRQAYSKITS